MPWFTWGKRKDDVYQKLYPEISVEISAEISCDNKTPVDVLISRQKENFGGILKELIDKRKKKGHWAWWVWPTEREGRSEPHDSRGGSSVTLQCIPYPLENTDVEKWTEILHFLNVLIAEHGFGTVIPGIDHGRIGGFLKLFLSVDDGVTYKYSKFFEQINVLDSLVPKKLQSPRGLARFTALNDDSDFSYGYARFTIYCDLNESGVDIVRVRKGPFGDKIGLHEIEESVKEKMIDDINSRMKKDMTKKKKKAFRGLRTEIRKSLIVDDDS